MNRMSNASWQHKCFCGEPAFYYYLAHQLKGYKLKARCEEHVIFTIKDRYPVEITEKEYAAFEVMLS